MPYVSTSLTESSFSFFYSKEIPEFPFQYNSIDKHYNVNRSSHAGDYAIENGRPRYSMFVIILVNIFCY